MLATVEKNEVKLWRYEAIHGDLIDSITNTSPVRACLLNHDVSRLYLLAKARDYYTTTSVYLLSTKQMFVLPQIDMHMDELFASKTNNRLVGHSHSIDKIKVWTVENPEEGAVLLWDFGKSHYDRIHFNPAGTWIICHSWGSSAVKSVETGEEIVSLECEVSNYNNAYETAFTTAGTSPSIERMAIAWPDYIVVWDTTTFTKLLEWHQDHTGAMRFGDDDYCDTSMIFNGAGTHLLCSFYMIVRVYDSFTGNLLLKCPLPKSSSPKLFYLGDGNDHFAVAGYKKGMIRVFQVDVSEANGGIVEVDTPFTHQNYVAPAGKMTEVGSWKAAASGCSICDSFPPHNILM